jgi:hypothetical protein
MFLLGIDDISSLLITKVVFKVKVGVFVIKQVQIVKKSKLLGAILYCKERTKRREIKFKNIVICLENSLKV